MADTHAPKPSAAAAKSAEPHLHGALRFEKVVTHLTNILQAGADHQDELLVVQYGGDVCLALSPKLAKALMPYVKEP